MAEQLDVARAEAIVAGMRIPEQPRVLLELRRELAREAPDIGRIAACIEQDVGLAALVLRTVNSPFFGFLMEVRSLRHATVMLGLQNMGNVVTGLTLRRSMESTGGAQPETFWESPANVALVAAQLAKRFGGVAPDQAYMLGLFRDCGEVLLAQRFPDYLATIARARAELVDGCRFTDIEDQHYDTNHAVVSHLVSRSWKLGAELSNVILDHHQACSRFAIADGQSSTELTLLAILKLAERVEERFRGIDGAEWRALREPVVDYFSLSGPDLDDIEADLLELLETGC